MALYGGPKSRVRSDLGVPDEKCEENGLEIWTYYNREGGRTVEVFFDERGRLIRILGEIMIGRTGCRNKGLT